MSDLIEFVDQETTLVNDLMFSREALECYSEKSEKLNGKKIQKGEIIGNRNENW